MEAIYYSVAGGSHIALLFTIDYYGTWQSHINIKHLSLTILIGS